MTTLEICCYGVDCALTAQQAGPIELNSVRHRVKAA